MRRWLGGLLALLLAAPALAGAPAATPGAWPLPASDLAIEPGYQLDRLPNGLRLAIRRNGNPAGTVLVRLVIEAGSLDEGDDERGFAHFVEHLAFQGSTRVPPGEMVKLLERQGLAFGADTNASTDYRATEYKLDLPRNDPALLDTALMLLRETASELRFDPAAVARERGVVLAERRERDTWAMRASLDRQQFTSPAARYVSRLPIGTLATLEAATPATLRAFWQRHYVPARAVVVVIGDIDPATARAAIARHFASWAPASAPPRATAGPVLADPPTAESIYLDPALAESVRVLRIGAYQDEADNRANRRRHLLRSLGYTMINRRFQSRARAAAPPFISAGFATSDIFHDGRITALMVQTRPGGWRAGLIAAAEEWRRAMARGFTRAELDEALANLRTGAEDAARAAATRHNGALLGAVEALVDEEVIPTSPADDLADFATFAPTITPAAVLAELNYEALALDDPAHPPLIRFEGKAAPSEGAAGLRAAWQAALALPLAEAPATSAGPFAYASFGPAGRVVADRREPRFGIRMVRFANGVRLNLKHTGIDKDRISLTYAIDGGELLDTPSDPLATAMAAMLPAGGLGKHSLDAVQSLLAGHAVALPFSAQAESFGGSARTTPRDLGLQLKLLAALVSDPGYRPEGERLWADAVQRMFATLRATPGAALAADQGGLLSDGDPRFTLQPAEAYRARTYARLQAAIADRLAHGAIELTLVGDIDEAAAIAAVAESFGALPPREPMFRTRPEARHRAFTTDHRLRTLFHTGPADQALVARFWLTRDDADPRAKQVLNLLDRVMRIALTEALREKLGKTYAPGAFSDPSRIWPGWGIFGIEAAVDVRDVEAVSQAIAATVQRLQASPVSADLLTRAREPLLQGFDNALKSDLGWLQLAAEAQRHPDRLARHARARARLLAVTAADVQAAARTWLVPARLVPVVVVPGQPAAPPPPPLPGK